MAVSDPIVLVKLGGSVLTDKQQPGVVREPVLERLADEVARAIELLPGGLILGHGSGSFGHVAAQRYELARGVHSRHQWRGVAETQSEAHRLHALVRAALLRAGTNPYSLAPSSFLTTASGRPVNFTLQPLVLALRRGLLPVVFGDVVMDREKGVTIFSTEAVFRILVQRLRQHACVVRRIVWVGETDGVYDAAGEPVPEITAENYEALLQTAQGSAGVDVTGGMRHRLETVWSLAGMGVESVLVNGLEAGTLFEALRGSSSDGTLVRRQAGGW